LSIFNQIKNLTKHSAIYTISTFIQRALGLVMLPVYTDVSYLASRSDYADYTLVYTFIAFMNVFYLYGLDAAFLRYFFLSKQKKEDIYFSAIQILSISSLITSVLLYTFSEPLAQLVFNESGYDFFIKMAAGILFFDTLCSLPYLILRAEEKSVHFSIIRAGRFFLELALNLFFVVYLGWGVKGILYANLLATIINFIVLLPFQFPYLRGKFSSTAIKELLKFGLPMLPNSFAYLIVEISDRYLMPRLIDKDTLGSYSSNYKFGSLMLLLVLAFRTAWQPFFLKIANQEDSKKIYARVMTYFILFASFVVLGGSLFVEYVVQIPIGAGKTLLGQSYWDGLQIIPLILFSYMLYGIYVNLTIGVYIKNKSHLMIIFTGLAALVNISSNFYLMPNFGMMGAAVATVLAYLVMVISIYIANHKIYPVKYEYLRIFVILLYLILGLTLFYYFSPSILIRLIIIGLFPVVFLFSKFFSREEKDDFKQLFQKVKNGKS
jgi:O-antigen/teichoic acid export membrane protein